MFSLMVQEGLSNSGAKTQETHLPAATSHRCIFTYFYFSLSSSFSIDSGPPGKEEAVLWDQGSMLKNSASQGFTEMFLRTSEEAGNVHPQHISY